MFFANALKSKITRREIERFVKVHRTDKYTLDIGCGNSPYAHYFTNRVGFDAVRGKGVDVIGDAHDLPFKENSFDQIVCIELLEHLHTPQKAISEMRRVLKPGGVLVLTTRFTFPLHEAPNDYFRFSKYGLQHLFRDWEIISLKNEETTFETFAVLLQATAMTSDIRGGKAGKAIVLFFSKIVPLFDFLLKRQFSNRRYKKEIQEGILTSGYHLLCRKPTRSR